MSNNTNTLFWVITGAVVVLSTFLLFQNGGNETLSKVTSTFGDMFNGNPKLAEHYGHEDNYGSLKITNESLFEFDEATQTITAYYGKDSDVVFPYEINGIEVKVIGDMDLWNKHLYAEDCEWLKEYYANADDEEKQYIEREIEWFEEMGIIVDGVCQESPLLTSIVIPNTVEVIGTCAFNYNRDLVSVTLPSSIKRIESQAFYENSIKSIKLDHLKDLSYIGVYAFANNNISGEVVIPDSVTSMDYYAFGNNDIDHAIVSANLSKLPMYTFYNNPNMKYVKFNNPQMSLNETITSNSNYTFSPNSSFIVKVPRGSKSWYSNIFARTNYKIEEY